MMLTTVARLGFPQGVDSPCCSLEVLHLEKAWFPKPLNQPAESSQLQAELLTTSHPGQWVIAVVVL